MPKIGHFILHSNVMPPITAGRYELVSEQSGLPFDVEPEHTHVHVAAPRYTMPTEQILSSFPPANAEGAFGDRLPQIVLKRRTLPWERNPAGGADPSPAPWLALVVVAEGEAELSSATPVRRLRDARTPALLEPDDKDVEQGLYLAVTETVVKKIFPCEQDLPLLTHVREVDVHDTELANGDDDGWLAVVLANRLPVFDEANGKPVRYMACLVNVEGQLPALPKPQPFLPVFEWALAQDWSVLAQANLSGGPDVQVMGGKGQGVVAGALPRAGLSSAAARANAALAPRAVPAGVQASAFAQFVAARPASPVGQALDGAGALDQPTVGTQWTQTAPLSQATQTIAAAALDPDAKRLVRDTMGIGFRFPIELYALEKVLRFPVLAHWSFTTNEGATFETLMQDLDVGLLGAAPTRAERRRCPASPTRRPRRPSPRAEVVQTGHIGLDHRTRRGDAVRAWYRGPCVPFPTPRDGGTVRNARPSGVPLAHSADQLRRVIPDGREDLALAAAFEIGRLLALSQLSVVSALMRFRAEQFGAGRVREILAQVLPFPLPGLGGAAHVRPDLGRFVALQMVGALAKNPAAMLGPRRPVADPGRPLEVKGELDEVIAAGLGIDLAALHQRAARVGVLAALEQTAVPLALKPGQAPNAEATLRALMGALQGELTRKLRVALPQSPVDGGVVGGGPIVRHRRGGAPAPRAAEPDALDELIAAAAAAAADEDRMSTTRRSRDEVLHRRAGGAEGGDPGAKLYADVVTDDDPDDGQHVVPGELRRFLARLRLLHGVPFSYLVPDAELLPPESIRFFYIDRAWTDALVQGALSVGTMSTADRAQLEAVYPHIRAEVDEAERVIRRPLGQDRLEGAGGTITGFVLRSRAVSGWPNLHVRAYAVDVLADDALTTAAESHPSRMKVLRMERLAPAVLLVLIDGVPAVVHIEEPRQGIQFGVRLDPTAPPAQRAARGALSRQQHRQPDRRRRRAADRANSVAVPFRAGAPGVIDLAELRKRLAQRPRRCGRAAGTDARAERVRAADAALSVPAGVRRSGKRARQQFFGLDTFKATVSLVTWKAAVKTNLGL